MKLCIWKDGELVKVYQNNRSIKLPNGDTVMNAKPDPSNDLFEYDEVGQSPNLWQTRGQIKYENDGWTVTATRTVQDVDLDVARRTAKGLVKVKRDIAMNAGIVWNSHIVQTDEDSRREMTGAVVAMNEAGLTEQAWRMMDNSLVILSDVDFKAMALAVRAHVNNCYVNQAQIEAQINACTTIVEVKSVDIETGWPVHYQPEQF